MVNRSGIASFLVGSVFFTVYSSAVNAGSADETYQEVFLPVLNLARANEGLPGLSGNIRSDLSLMGKECSRGVQNSCDFVRNFQASSNHRQGTPQQQQLQQLQAQQMQLEQMQRMQKIQDQFSRPVIGGMYQPGCEAMGLHGDCTTRAKLDADTERTAPHY